MDKDEQIDNLQTSLASVTGQLLIMHENLEEKDTQINELRRKIKKQDNTLTIVQGLVNLYRFLFPPGKI